MAHDGLFGIPEWLFVGLGVGVCVSLLAAGLFVLADRRYPTRNVSRDRNSGDDRKREELRAYLDAIGEQYAEDHPVEGQPVAFYLPERDVAITFDARAYYRIERAGTVAVLVEHEMPGVQLGARLPFEVPQYGVGPGSGSGAGPGSSAGARGTDGGFGATAGTGVGARAGYRDPASAAFAELGVPAGATLDEVKAAYRRRVKETHPDQGGDEDEFKRVREAYTTAKKHAS